MKRAVFLSLLLFLFLGCSNSSKLTVGTLNIRNSNANDGNNNWSNRQDLVVNFIKQNKISIIGLQEVLPDQYSYLRNNLTDYEAIGPGRVDGQNKGEANPIFFNKERFLLKSHSIFWLSKTPQKPGSKAWNSACPRIVTWVQLSDKQTNRDFFIFNTHFDHYSQEARENSALLLLSQISDITKRAPFILVGDFNCSLQSKTFKTLTTKWNQKPVLNPVITKPTRGFKGVSYTYNDFGNVENHQIIDHIFISSNLKENKARIHKIKNQNIYISDHYPVTTNIKFTTQKNNYPISANKLSLPLFPPYLKNMNNIFTNKTKVEISCFSKNAKIHYTLDQSEPTLDSPQYNEPIVLTKSCELKARSFQGNQSSDQIMHQKFYKSILDTSINLDEIILNNPINPEYYGDGINTLIDKERGSIHNPEHGWIGFQRNDIDIVLDFGKKIVINRFALGFFVNPQSRIFKPEKVIILCSNNSLRY
ncbi:MAG: chitobiase/beta-hexosaminidase C-terminal domain-containing protein, partial [Candidatus Marinimicrobia bacterium]|nr:chitobiase/beta-hexosaminidase C-terminal domain-containing protein [Candidatus Neomarinimicrobiota bacterium]